MSGNFSFVSAATLVGLFLASSNAFAENISPLSPAFILAPYQVMATSSVGYSDGRYRSTLWGSGLSSPASRSTVTNLSQSVAVGLPWDSVIGLAGSYQHIVSSDDWALGENEIHGFSSPTIFLSTILGADNANRLQITVGATPKTDFRASRDLPTQYSISSTGIFIASNGVISKAGLSRNIYQGDTQTNSTGIFGEVHKEFGLYSASLGGGISWPDTHDDANIHISNSPNYYFSAKTGRQLSNTISLQLSYNHAFGDRKVELKGGLGGIDSSYRFDILNLSISLLF